LPFWLELHENAPKGRFKRQQSGNQSHLGRWQNKCRISQGISFDANFPKESPLLVKHVNGATSVTGIPTGVISGIPGGFIS
jgi:hypothetical protein